MYAVCVPLSISRALVEGVNSAPAIRVRANLFSRKLSLVTEKSVCVHLSDYQSDHTNPYPMSITLPACTRCYTFRGSPVQPWCHFQPLAPGLLKPVQGCWFLEGIKRGQLLLQSWRRSCSKEICYASCPRLRCVRPHVRKLSLVPNRSLIGL